MCGEKLKFGTNVTKNPGSPPRVRGKVVLCPDVLFPFGDHPACAGKRDRIGRMRLSFRITPRVWGKDAIQRHPSCGFGITFACAGKRRTDSKTTLSHEDHPRVCGEKTPFSENSFTKSGSPPRVRGKGVVCIIRGRAGGITPACAGKSVRILQLLRVDKDHPRVCGEKKWLWLS